MEQDAQNTCIKPLHLAGTPSTRKCRRNGPHEKSEGEPWNSSHLREATLQDIADDKVQGSTDEKSQWRQILRRRTTTEKGPEQS